MGEKISVQDIAEVLAKAEGLQKNEAQSFVRVFFDTVFKGLGQDKYVKIKGLGAFKIVEVDNRESINVNTGERFTIGGHAKISFTTDNNLKELVNKPFAHFETVMLNEHVTDDDLEMVNHRFEDTNHEKDVLNQGFSSQSVSIQNEQDTTLCPFDDQEHNNNIPEVTEKYEVLANSKEHLESNNQSSPEQLQFDSPIASNMVSDVEQTKVPSKRSFRNWVWAMLCFIAMLLGYVVGQLEFSSFNIRDYFTIVHDTVLERELVHDTIWINKDSFTEESKELKHATAANNGANQDKYADMPEDGVPQVKGGAYQIVGLRETYTLRSGETIRIIAERFYGSREMALYIATYNHIVDANKVAAGTVLKIPELKLKTK